MVRLKPSVILKPLLARCDIALINAVTLSVTEPGIGPKNAIVLNVLNTKCVKRDATLHGATQILKAIAG